MATPHSMQLHGSISYGDGARCWENAFQAFGSSKILLGEDPDPPHRLRNFAAPRVGLHTTWSAPRKPKILATPLVFFDRFIAEFCVL